MSGKQTPSERIGAIIRDAAASEASASDDLSQEDLRSLADRVDLLTADFGKWEAYKAASTEYIDAFKTEADWHWRIRLAVAIAGGTLVLFLAVCLVLGVLWAGPLFRPDQAHALTALIIGCITGSVIVTIALVKGAFSNLSDRNAGLPMPEHMKEIVDAAKSIVGGPSAH